MPPPPSRPPGGASPLSGGVWFGNGGRGVGLTLIGVRSEGPGACRGGLGAGTAAVVCGAAEGGGAAVVDGGACGAGTGDEDGGGVSAAGRLVITGAGDGRVVGACGDGAISTDSGHMNTTPTTTPATVAAASNHSGPRRRSIDG